MNRKISLGVLIVGSVLILCGFFAISVQRTIAFTCGGIAYIILGGYGLLQRREKSY